MNTFVRAAIKLILVAVILVPGLSSGSAIDELTTTTPSQGTSNTSTTQDKKPSLTWRGYAILNYQQYDFYQNVQDDTAERRARTDIERIVLEPRFDLGHGFLFIAEVEFEHGGTGSTVEFEPEEAGEFETEIEKGGEVIIEKAVLVSLRSPKFNWQVGELGVAFGMINLKHKPDDYFTLERSLAETSLLPVAWHEFGIGFFGKLGKLGYQAQLITALDSSGFSGAYFVRNSTQGLLEFDNANDLAAVVSLNYAVTPEFTLSGAFYTGDSSGNRPRDNLNKNALLQLFEVHGEYSNDPFTLRGQYLSGRLKNSEAITRANLTTFNGSILGISRTPVGKEANSWFLEAGVNILHFRKVPVVEKLIAFARMESWDTHAAVEGAIIKDQRYDRSATTVGVNFIPRPGIIFKAEYSHRTHEGTQGTEQNLFGLGVGVRF